MIHMEEKQAVVITLNPQAIPFNVVMDRNNKSSSHFSKDSNSNNKNIVLVCPI
jgi:hypothetical protein